MGAKGTNDSDFDDEPLPQPKGKNKIREVDHKSYSTAQLQGVVENDISQVASIVGLEVHDPPQSIPLSHSVDLLSDVPPMSPVHPDAVARRLHSSAPFQLEQRPPH